MMGVRRGEGSLLRKVECDLWFGMKSSLDITHEMTIDIS